MMIKFGLAPAICAIFIFGLGTSTVDAGNFYADQASPGTIGTISTLLADSVADGCWTNLGEVETYAKDKLRLQGFDVVGKGEGNYQFFVYALGGRDNQGWCSISVSIEIFKPTVLAGISGYHMIGNTGGMATRKDNANTVILNFVKKMIDQM